MWGYGPEWGMMGGWGGGWMGPFMMIFWLIILGLAVAAVVWLIRSTTHSSMPPPRVGRSRGVELLDERYARGEINRDEYLQKRGDILG
jgi:putative membrane protein